jgi:lipopolysaccharide transport system ATP-binding protein
LTDMAKVIEVNNVSKLYRLGHISSTTVKDDLSRWWNRVRGREDTSLKLGDPAVSGDKIHWALQDVSFSVEQGEVMGFIGKNGAGKSTLLKILSRVTGPTSGTVKMHGRIASLLEVGTGFHPDLSGRENIYQNGAILGMQRNEIKSKLDEIIAFSGVEKFIDTPVKRYSSGMYVRLAFAVAAHLEPEILIVDEVLAVGDADFQKKCMGKIKDVSTGEGRTVLFVSHNMTAIQSLCNKAILLTAGKINSEGLPADVVNNYLNIYSNEVVNKSWKENGPGNDKIQFRHVRLSPEKNIRVDSEITIDFSFNCSLAKGKINISLHLYTIRDELVFATASPVQDTYEGLMHFQCAIPANFLNDEMFKISIMVINDGRAVYVFEEALVFEVNDLPRDTGWLEKWPGVIRPTLEWNFHKINGHS